MAFSDLEILGMSYGYTDEIVLGGGAIKGKNCTIKSISEITGGHRVTFEWTLDDGTVETATMDVKDGREGNDNRLMIIAHRGVEKTGEAFYGNTIKAIQNAVESGYSWCEIDAQESKDGAFIMSHDTSINVYKNGVATTISIKDTDLADIRDCTWDAAGNYPVNTLDEIFSAFRNEPISFILDSNVFDYFLKMMDTVKYYGMQNKVIVSAHSNVIHFYMVTENDLAEYSDLRFRVILDNSERDNFKYVVENLKAEVYLDASITSGFLERHAYLLSFKKPIIAYGFDSSSSRLTKRKSFINFIVGAMANDFETYAETLESTMLDTTPSGFTTNITGDYINLIGESSVSIEATNDTEGGGYINMFTTDTEMAFLDSITTGETSTATLTKGTKDGYSLLSIFNGTMSRNINVNASASNFVFTIGDASDSGPTYSSASGKMTLRSFTGDFSINYDKSATPSKRKGFTSKGYSSKYFAAEIPSGATTLTVDVDTSKVANGATYIKIYDSTGAKIVSDAWNSHHSLTIPNDAKYVAITARYDSSASSLTTSDTTGVAYVNNKFIELESAISYSFT